MRNETTRNPSLIRNVALLLSHNARCLIMFQTVYKIIGACIMIPLFFCSLNACMALRGLRYLGPDNLSVLLKFPGTWICAILLALLMAIYALVDISATLLIFEMSHQRRKASLKGIMKAAVQQAVRTAKPANLPFVVFVLLVLPLTGFVLAPSFVGQITIPEFIMEFIEQKLLFCVLAAVVSLIPIVFVIRNRFAFHAFVLKGMDFKQACKESKQLAQKHHVGDLAFCLVMQLLAFVATVAVITLLSLAIFELGTAFQNSGLGSKALEVGLSSAILVVALVIVLIACTCGTPLSYAFVSALYYQRLSQRKEEAAATETHEPVDYEALGAKPSKAMRSIGRLCGVGAYLLAVLVLSIYFTGITIETNANAENGSVDVVAHRCGARYAPENTVAALRTAAGMGATWCEIDVQKCADGSIIVLHDESLERTGGLSKNSWEVTYDEVAKLDAGSLFSEEFAGERIPLLEEMITAAKEEGMKLQIEIKPTGHDEGIEQDVVDIIHAYDFQDDCAVLSLSLDCIQKVRDYDPEIQTVYLMSFAYGDVASISCADSYSIESTWATMEVAENIHTVPGSLLAAWTVNKEETMRRAIGNGADQLVTDDIELARKAVSRTQRNQTVLLRALGAFGNLQQSMTASEAIEGTFIALGLV